MQVLPRPRWRNLLILNTSWIQSSSSSSAHLASFHSNPISFDRRKTKSSFVSFYIFFPFHSNLWDILFLLIFLWMRIDFFSREKLSIIHLGWIHNGHILFDLKFKDCSFSSRHDLDGEFGAAFLTCFCIKFALRFDLSKFSLGLCLILEKQTPLISCFVFKTSEKNWKINAEDFCFSSVFGSQKWTSIFNFAFLICSCIIFASLFGINKF